MEFNVNLPSISLLILLSLMSAACGDKPAETIVDATVDTAASAAIAMPVRLISAVIIRAGN